MSTTQTQQSIGERIADEFSRDKVFLTTAEQRRLAGMIDKHCKIVEQLPKDAAGKPVIPTLTPLYHPEFGEHPGYAMNNGQVRFEFLNGWNERRPIDECYSDYAAIDE